MRNVCMEEVRLMKRYGDSRVVGGLITHVYTL